MNRTEPIVCSTVAFVPKNTEPTVGAASPAAKAASVLFPDPLGPIMATCSPGWIEKLAFSSANSSAPSYRNDTPSNTSAAVERSSAPISRIPSVAASASSGVLETPLTVGVLSEQVLQHLAELFLRKAFACFLSFCT